MKKQKVINNNITISIEEFKREQKISSLSGENSILKKILEQLLNISLTPKFHLEPSQ